MATVWGVSMVKDEADIVEHTIRHMLTQVDRVLVADNGSSDGTRDILVRLMDEVGDRRLVVTDDAEPGYYQSAKMSALAHEAGRRGADWVVPFDADECWRSPWGRVGDVLAGLPETESIALAALYDHVPTDRDDPTEPNPFRRIRWHRLDRAPLWKVAVRPTVRVTIEQGNHGAHYNVESTPNPVLEVRHFPYRSAEQMVRKAVNGKAAYDATDLPEDLGSHWRGYGAIVEGSGPEALHGVFYEFFHSTHPERDGLVEDPAA